MFFKETFDQLPAHILNKMSHSRRRFNQYSRTQTCTLSAVVLRQETPENDGMVPPRRTDGAGVWGVSGGFPLHFDNVQALRVSQADERLVSGKARATTLGFTLQSRENGAEEAANQTQYAAEPIHDSATSETWPCGREDEVGGTAETKELLEATPKAAPREIIGTG